MYVIMLVPYRKMNYCVLHHSDSPFAEVTCGCVCVHCPKSSLNGQWPCMVTGKWCRWGTGAREEGELDGSGKQRRPKVKGHASVHAGKDEVQMIGLCRCYCM